jgi:hypothetical protein
MIGVVPPTLAGTFQSAAAAATDAAVWYDGLLHCCCRYTVHEAVAAGYV